MIRASPQTCPECGTQFYCTAAEDIEIRRGWLAPEAICPGDHEEEEGRRGRGVVR